MSFADYSDFLPEGQTPDPHEQSPMSAVTRYFEHLEHCKACHPVDPCPVGKSLAMQAKTVCDAFMGGERPTGQKPGTRTAKGIEDLIEEQKEKITCSHRTN